MKPKVLIIIDTYYVGGAGKVILQFLANADHSKFDYVLCSFRYRNPPSTEFIQSARDKGFHLKLFPQRFRFDISPLWQIFSFMREEKIDIFESHGYKGHLLAWACKLCSGTGWIGVTHGWTNENWKVRLYNGLERWLLKRADWVISVSPDIAQLMQTLRGPEKRTSLILNAVDQAAIYGEGEAENIVHRAKITATTLLIGVFGRLSPEKGHALLLKSLSPLLATEDIVLLFVGDGPERQNLSDLAGVLGIKSRVMFEGQKKNMRDYFEAIDLLVVPSYSEGLPLVVLESMALEIPVLATDVGAIRRVITDGQNGWIVEPGVEDVLREKLSMILTDKERLSVVGQIAKKSLEPFFLPKRQSGEVVEVYRELYESRKHQYQ